MINDNNKIHFLLGVLVTSLSIVLYKEIMYVPSIFKTETIVRMVDEPFIRGDFEVEASEIQSTLNKSKLKHLLIYVNALCDEYGINYEMVKAVIQTESSWNHKAVSQSGAIGLMQVLPNTAEKEFNTPEGDLFDPYVNVTVGIKYLFELNNHFDDIDALLTAYSHGPTITKKYSQKYIKSNFYVKRVYNNM